MNSTNASSVSYTSEHEQQRKAHKIIIKRQRRPWRIQSIIIQPFLLLPLYPPPCPPPSPFPSVKLPIAAIRTPFHFPFLDGHVRPVPSPPRRVVPLAVVPGFRVDVLDGVKDGVGPAGEVDGPIPFLDGAVDNEAAGVAY
jgi:hypothetical protein